MIRPTPLVFLALLGIAATLGAAPHKKFSNPQPMPSAPAIGLGVWTLKTDPLDFNYQSGDFSAPNKVFLTRNGGDVTADRANGNFKKQIATMYGHVVMHDENGSFAGVAGVSSAKTRGPSTLTADQLQLDGIARVYTAIGHVHYVQETTTVDADRAMLNDASHMLYLSGNARIVQGLRSLVAAHIAYNTVTGSGQAEGNVIMQFPSAVQPHIATPKPIKIPGITHATATPSP
jgi:lipopolysaccharide assembly outer membrane protein LptD (OstA)